MESKYNLRFACKVCGKIYKQQINANECYDKHRFVKEVVMQQHDEDKTYPRIIRVSMKDGNEFYYEIIKTQ